jgi:CheY-like chemotaxis protein
VIAPTKLKRVLFVDDSPDYLETLGRVIGGWSEGEWEILLAQGSSEAFSMLEAQPADLVVIDVLMPVVDGVQLLRMLHRSHPAMRKVVLTGMVEPVLRSDCLKQGADLFLEKPRTVAEMEIVYRALKHVLALEETSGFRGVLRRANIRDIIQMECLNQRSSIVEISAEEAWGEIFIERGNVVHAQAAGSKGGEAFAQLVNLKAGEFKLKPFTEPGERTLSSRFEALLLAAAHAWDELLAGPPPAPQPNEPVSKKEEDTTTTWFRRKGEEDSAGAAQRAGNNPAP